MKVWDKLKIAKSIFFSTLLMSSSTWAGISLTNTRVVYPSNEVYVNVQLKNQLDKPALAQVWIDNGNPEVMPDAKALPFLLTPPVSRVNAKSNQTIRIMLKPNMNLAQDRESIYWFNLLDIPPVSKADEGKNLIQFSVRSRIKLFYRPQNLSMSQAEAYKSLQFMQIVDQSSIKIHNPSPYYITFASLKFKGSSVNELVYTADVMLAPFASETISMKQFNSPLKRVDYEVLNDLGGQIAFEADIR